MKALCFLFLAQHNIIIHYEDAIYHKDTNYHDEYYKSTSINSIYALIYIAS